MTVEEAIAIVATVLFPEKLNTLELDVFRCSWDGMTYPQMAEELGYSAESVKNVGAKLYKKLEPVFGNEYHRGYGFNSSAESVAQSIGCSRVGENLTSYWTEATVMPTGLTQVEARNPVSS